MSDTKNSREVKENKEEDKVYVEDTIQLPIIEVRDETKDINEEDIEKICDMEFTKVKKSLSERAKIIAVAVIIVLVIISSGGIVAGILEKDKLEVGKKKAKQVAVNVDKSKRKVVENVEEDVRKDNEVIENVEPEVTKDNTITTNNNKTECNNNLEDKNQDKVQDTKQSVINSTNNVVESKQPNNIVMPQGENFLHTVENKVLQKINDERNKAGLSNLINSEVIKKYARVKVKDMADNGYLASKDLKGNLVSTYMKNDGVAYGSWGENIAYVTYNEDPEVLAEKFISNFMNSTNSKDKILSSTYSQVGIGIYKSGDRVYIAQEFIR